MKELFKLITAIIYLPLVLLGLMIGLIRFIFMNIVLIPVKLSDDVYIYLMTILDDWLKYVNGKKQ